MEECIYFDNAATSWPKPEAMIKAMVDFNANVGANPGRSGHRLSIEAGRVIFHARETIASLLGADDPHSVIFTRNATEGLNTILRGFLRPGDHVITSSMEHNSVMRPLRALESEGVELSVVKMLRHRRCFSRRYCRRNQEKYENDSDYSCVQRHRDNNAYRRYCGHRAQSWLGPVCRCRSDSREVSRSMY